jgi:hypothetical protein
MVFLLPRKVVHSMMVVSTKIESQTLRWGLRPHTNF